MCGESAAIDFVRELMYTTGEEVEVRLGLVVRRAHKCFTCCYLTSISDELLNVFFSSVFVVVVPIGPHLPATNSFHHLRPGCGVLRQPQTRGLHRVFQ